MPERTSDHTRELNSYLGAQRIESWPIEKVPYARNPRTHSDAQVAQIAASIAEFGFNNPMPELKAARRAD